MLKGDLGTAFGNSVGLLHWVISGLEKGSNCEDSKVLTGKSSQSAVVRKGQLHTLNHAP